MRMRIRRARVIKLTWPQDEDTLAYRLWSMCKLPGVKPAGEVDDSREAACLKDARRARTAISALAMHQNGSRRVKLGEAGPQLGERDEDRAGDRARRMLGGFAHVEDGAVPIVEVDGRDLV